MLLASLRATVVFALLTGAVYPAVVTVIAHVALPDHAEGSLVRDGQVVVGSRLVGQAFTSPGYLQGRPSVGGYDASASGGSNLAVTSPKLAERRASDEVRLRAENPDAPLPIPEPLLATSGSGLDPHLPVDAARWQLPRVAKARNVDLARLEGLLDEQVEGPDLGFLGEARVNVLAFNLALDRRFPRAPLVPG